MSEASPGNPLPINCWKCMFDSVLSASKLKGGKEAICWLPASLSTPAPLSRVGEQWGRWEVQADW